jgi:peptidoglycan-associated lipoprotein
MNKRLLIAVILLIAAGMMMFACGPKPEPTPPEPPPSIDTTTPPPPPPPPSGEEPPPPPRTTELMPIYFDFDKANLKSEAKSTLNANAELIKSETGKIIIEGHCDERGTNEYNLALGERRALAAYEYLRTLGISSDRMSTISYGEERPATMGHDESAWSRNRRAEFVRSGR